jgi:release factor glutamine methyltransferase
VADVSSTVIERLTAAGCVAADEEASELIDLAADDAALETLVCRREQGEPLAWVTGSVRFCGHRVRVDEGVYVPRAQTEELARRAGARLASREGDGRAADLCSGSGAIAFHLQVTAPAAAVVALDCDPRAASCAARNGVNSIVADLGEALLAAELDVVTAVAPYVPTAELKFLPADVRRYEPRRALDGGSDGLDVVRRVVRSAARLLRPGGWLLTEIGGDQDRRLGPTLELCGFSSSVSWFDGDGDLRGLEARRDV